MDSRTHPGLEDMAKKDFFKGVTFGQDLKGHGVVRGKEQGWREWPGLGS